MTSGIAGAGMYLPRYRLPTATLDDAWDRVSAAGIERTAVPAADEDALTMAVTAAERAIEAAGRDRQEFAGISWATTTPPMAEGAMLGRLVRALDLPASVEPHLETGSTLAGARAMATGARADGPVLVVASDCPRGDLAGSDHAFGAGAAAFVLAPDGPATMRAAGWHVEERAGIRFRPASSDTVDGLGVRAADREARRTAMTSAVEAAGEESTWTSAAAVAIHQPNGRVPHRIAGALPLDDAAVEPGIVVDRTGDLGAATVPVALAQALDATGGNGPIGACFFGGGSAGAFLFAGAPVPVVGSEAIDAGESIAYSSYLRLRGELGDGSVPGGGANVSLADWERHLAERYRLVGGNCQACGELTFPPSGACPTCHERGEIDRVELDREGDVVAASVVNEGGAPPEFAPQQRRGGAYGIAVVELSGRDGSVRVPGQLTDVDPDAVAVGERVSATFRRLYTQEGIVRYGTKFVPVRTA